MSSTWPLSIQEADVTGLTQCKMSRTVKAGQGYRARLKSSLNLSQNKKKNTAFLPESFFFPNKKSLFWFIVPWDTW